MKLKDSRNSYNFISLRLLTSAVCIHCYKRSLFRTYPNEDPTQKYSDD